MLDNVRPHRIELRISQGTRREESSAGEAGIKPGMLLRRMAEGKVIKHDLDGQAGELLFAYEDALQGRTIRDAYTEGDPVFQVVALPGDEVFALVATGEDVIDASPMTSNGDGTLRVASGTDEVVAIAVEDYDLTEAEAPEHVKVRVASSHEAQATPTTAAPTTTTTAAPTTTTTGG